MPPKNKRRPSGNSPFGRGAAAPATSAKSKKAGSTKDVAPTAEQLRAYMTGEGKSLNDVVTLDDYIHAAELGGAAPNAEDVEWPEGTEPTE